MYTVDVSTIKTAAYSWDMDSFISSMKTDGFNGKIVRNKNNQLLLRVDDFVTMVKFFGRGRTAWCVTRDEAYFKRYTTRCTDDVVTTIYVLLDFNKAENDSFSHLGFTYSPKHGAEYFHDMRSRHNFTIELYILEQLQNLCNKRISFAKVTHIP